jgi:hypothetical protein
LVSEPERLSIRDLLDADGLGHGGVRDLARGDVHPDP